MTRETTRRDRLTRTVGLIVLVLFLLAAVAILAPIVGLWTQTTVNGGSFAPTVTSIPTP